RFPTKDELFERVVRREAELRELTRVLRTNSAPASVPGSGTGYRARRAAVEVGIHAVHLTDGGIGAYFDASTTLKVAFFIA
ncbi:hypothetical protein PJK45_30050, partial [Mycobacterium kansasii]